MPTLRLALDIADFQALCARAGITFCSRAEAAVWNAPPLLRSLGARGVLFIILDEGASDFGLLVVVDNRVIIVSPSKRIVWRFPTPGARGSGMQLSQPDDAFVSGDGRYISINHEFADSIALISLTRDPRIMWR